MGREQRSGTKAGASAEQESGVIALGLSFHL